MTSFRFIITNEAIAVPSSTKHKKHSKTKQKILDSVGAKRVKERQFLTSDVEARETAINDKCLLLHYFASFGHPKSAPFTPPLLPNGINGIDKYSVFQKNPPPG